VCCRLLDSIKMPSSQTRPSGFHICDILDLNDGKVNSTDNTNTTLSSHINGKNLKIQEYTTADKRVFNILYYSRSCIGYILTRLIRKLYNIYSRVKETFSSFFFLCFRQLPTCTTWARASSFPASCNLPPTCYTTGPRRSPNSEVRTKSNIRIYHNISV